MSDLDINSLARRLLDTTYDTSNTAVRVNVVAGSAAATEYTEGDTDATFAGIMALAEGPTNTAKPLLVDASQHLQVDIAADSVGIGGGTEYTEGDTDATLTGKVMLMEVAANTVQPVQGTVADGLLVNLGANNDVTVAGVSTAANQATMITHLATLAGAVGGTEMQVDIVAALPAGTNAIGKLAANSGVDIGDVDILSIAAGDNNIGNVDIASALPAGTNNIGDVDVLTVPADPFGANADAAATAGSTGSMQAKLRLMTSQLDAIKTAVEVLDNSIAGSEIQADIVAALPAGTNLLGRTAASDETSTIYNGTTALTPKFAIIDAATSGDNTLVAAVNAKKIRVVSAFLIASGAVTVRFESGAGGTALSGQMNVAANGGFSLPYNPAGWFQTAGTTLLNLELSGATSVDGCLSYIEV